MTNELVRETEIKFANYWQYKQFGSQDYGFSNSCHKIFIEQRFTGQAFIMNKRIKVNNSPTLDILMLLILV